jgi:hypothetical protein
VKVLRPLIVKLSISINGFTDRGVLDRQVPERLSRWEEPNHTAYIGPYIGLGLAAIGFIGLAIAWFLLQRENKRESDEEKQQANSFLHSEKPIKLKTINEASTRKQPKKRDLRAQEEKEQELSLSFKSVTEACAGPDEKRRIVRLISEIL